MMLAPAAPMQPKALPSQLIPNSSEEFRERGTLARELFVWEYVNWFGSPALKGRGRLREIGLAAIGLAIEEVKRRKNAGRRDNGECIVDLIMGELWSWSSG